MAISSIYSRACTSVQVALKFNHWQFCSNIEKSNFTSIDIEYSDYFSTPSRKLADNLKQTINPLGLLDFIILLLEYQVIVRGNRKVSLEQLESYDTKKHQTTGDLHRSNTGTDIEGFQHVM